MAMIPTVVVYGSKGKIIINQCDLPDWKAKGYSTEPPAEQVQEPEKRESAKVSLGDLRAKATSLGILNAAKLKEAELVKAIEEVTAGNG